MFLRIEGFQVEIKEINKTWNRADFIKNFKIGTNWNNIFRWPRELGQLFFCVHCLLFQPRAVYIIWRAWNLTPSTTWGPSLGTRLVWVTPLTSFTSTPRGSTPSPGWGSPAVPREGGLYTRVSSWCPWQLFWCTLGGDETKVSLEDGSLQAWCDNMDISYLHAETRAINIQWHKWWRILWHQNWKLWSK